MFELDRTDSEEIGHIMASHSKDQSLFNQEYAAYDGDTLLEELREDEDFDTQTSMTYDSQAIDLKRRTQQMLLQTQDSEVLSVTS